MCRLITTDKSAVKMMRWSRLKKTYARRKQTRVVQSAATEPNWNIWNAWLMIVTQSWASDLKGMLHFHNGIWTKVGVW